MTTGEESPTEPGPSAKRIVVIYHADCVDGFTAAWCARRKFGDTAEYVPAKYGDTPPDVHGANVYVLDFSYPRDVLIGMNVRANTLRVLDHHKTAQAALAGLPFCEFDMECSGARMAWDHFAFGPERVPGLVRYVEDRDLWRWALPFSKEVSAMIGCAPRTFEAWGVLADRIEDEFESVASEGAAILRAQQAYCDAMVRRARTIPWDGVEVPIVNCSPIHVSEIVGALAEQSPHGWAIGWSQGPDGKFHYSLRSRGNGPDVSALAKRFGGGGHRGAAGFSLGGLLVETDDDHTRTMDGSSHA